MRRGSHQNHALLNCRLMGGLGRQSRSELENLLLASFSGTGRREAPRRESGRVIADRKLDIESMLSVPSGGGSSTSCKYSCDIRLLRLLFLLTLLLLPLLPLKRYTMGVAAIILRELFLKDDDFPLLRRLPANDVSMEDPCTDDRMLALLSWELINFWCCCALMRRLFFL